MNSHWLEKPPTHVSDSVKFFAFDVSGKAPHINSSEESGDEEEEESEKQKVRKLVTE